MSAISMLFGAALVAIGVLAAALADRIRGLRVSRPQPRGSSSREVESAPPVIAEQPPASTEVTRQKQLAADVIVALIGAGYKKSDAGAATWGCGVAERASLESWTRAALIKINTRQ